MIFPEDSFEQQYIALRSKEQRIYTDQEVARLPEIGPSHVHYKEWVIRKNSSQHLIQYLKRKKQSLNMLEIGCGNGWLSSRLSDTGNCRVTGIDINSTELRQAERVFHGKKNLSFVSGDIRSGILNNAGFNIIVFAASLQYFSSLSEVFLAAFNHLHAGGEIHIIDTRFYRKEQLEAARQATRDYFCSLGFAGMASHYFHHCTEDLKKFNPQILFSPDSLKSKVFGNRSPFYWVSIKNN